MAFIESLLYPCCTPVVLHTLSQYSMRVVVQPLLLLGASSLSAAISKAKQPLHLLSVVYLFHRVKPTKLYEELE